jgi:uncharacterized protein involved in exopolysaccharide biosynthesis
MEWSDTGMDRDRTEIEEIELKEFFHALWKWKWAVFGLTVLTVISAVVIDGLMPFRWETEVAVRTDLPKELAISPTSIAETITNASGARSLAKRLGMDPESLPQVRASVSRGSQRLLIVVEDQALPEARSLAERIVSYLNRRIQERLLAKGTKSTRLIFLWVETAVRKSRPHPLSRTGLVIMASLLGFVGYGLVAFLWECLEQRRRTAIRFDA